MLPRKRRPSLENDSNKRRKQSGYSSQRCTNDITSWNSLNSPLLRLPAELRDRIWHYAYGFMTVHPGPPIPIGQMQRSYGYRVCPFTSPKDLYALSLKGADPEDPSRYAATVLSCKSAGSCSCTHAYCDEFTIPLTSKQFFFEASAVWLATGTISFSSPSEFKSYMDWMVGRTPQIPRIAIEISGIDQLELWEGLMHRYIHRFSRVLGVRLVIGVYEDLSDTMQDEIFWDDLEFSCLVQALRKRELVEEETSVVFVPEGSRYSCDIADLRTCAGFLMKLLLQPTGKGS